MDELTLSLATGDATADENNRQLFAMLNILAALDDDGFAPAYADLLAMLERDFRREDALMEDIAYPAAASHRELHARVLSGLHHSESALLQGDSTPARRCVELLPKWLEMHIATQDAPLFTAAELTLEHPAAPL